MTGVGYYFLQLTIKEYAFSRIEYIAKAKANEIEKFFFQKKLLLDIVGDTEKIKKFVISNDIRGIEESVDSFLDKTDSFDLILTNKNGIVLYSHQGVFPGGLDILKSEDQTKLKEIIEWSHRQSEVRTLLLDFDKNVKYDDKEVMFVARPIFDKGKNISSIILVYSADNFRRFIKKEVSKNLQDLGDSGNIAIYGEDSLLRASSNELNNSSIPFGAQGIRSMESSGQITDLIKSDDGTSYFRSITKVNLPDNLVWYEEVSVLESDIFKGLYHLFAGFILIMFTVVSVVSLLSYYGNLKIIRPLYDVIDSIKTLGTSEKPQKLEVVDSYELGYLVRNYNELVDRLQWTQLSRNYFEGILESIHEFVFIVERETNEHDKAIYYIKQINKSICESFKIGRYDLVGTNLKDVLHLDSIDFDQFILSESDVFVEGKLSVLGFTLPVIVKPSQVRSVGERNYVILCNDISLQKQQQNALVRAKEEAIKASYAKSEFLAKMSHEIRTPLNVIVGISDILKSTQNISPDTVEMVSILSSASENLLALINDILDISKIEAQEIKVENIPTDSVSIVNDVLKIMRTKATSKGIKLNFIYDSDKIMPCFMDPTRLRQIILNLVGNSVKFTDHGSVDVVLSFYEEENKSLLFEVRDTGIGIPREQQGLLFKNFVQAEGSIGRKYGGTGLGLSISKNLVELLGGKIWLQSDLGQGTSFFFTLPYKPLTKTENIAFDTGNEIKINNVVQLDRSKKYKILVTDDTEDNRILIRAYLKGLAVDVVEAEDGLKAVNLVKSGHVFDLIFIDIQMPIMDGYSATQEIRKYELANKLRRTPILALSANAMVEDFEKSKKMDCDAHLTKPIRKNEVINAITKYAA